MYIDFLIKNIMIPTNQQIKSVIKKDVDNGYCLVQNVPDWIFFLSSVMKEQIELEFKLNVT